MSSRKVHDELREILSRFQYMSSRTGVGLRQLEEHHIRALVGEFEPILAAKDERIAELETKLHDAIWALKGVVPSGGVSVVIDELQTVIEEGEAG